MHGVPPWQAELDRAHLHRPRAARRACVVAEALFAGGEPVPAERIAWLGKELDDFLEHAGAASRTSWLAALTAVTFAAPLFVRRTGPLGRLGVAQRIEALTLLEHSPAAGAMIGVKALLCILYYEHPRVAAELGLGGCLNDAVTGGST